MTPPFVDIAEIETDSTTLRHYMVGSLATGSQFQLSPSLQVMPERVIGLVQAPAFRQLNPLRDATGSVAFQTLFEPAEPVLGVRTEAAETAPRFAEWVVDVLDRLIELHELPVDWDHHGAPPIDEKDIGAALNVLNEVMAPDTPPPAIVPISGGGLQMEWHRASLDVEIVVGLGDDDGLYLREVNSGREWEGPTLAGFAEHVLAQRLTG